MVDTDRITGAAQALGGKLQGAVGDLTGSRRDSVEGRARVVRRLARLTGVPNQSPHRCTACPQATPARSGG